MFVEFTEEEKAEMQAIESKYDALEREICAQIDAHPYADKYPSQAFSTEPGGLMEKFKFDKTHDEVIKMSIFQSEEYQAAYDESSRLLDIWFDERPDDFKVLQDIQSEYIQQRADERHVFFRKVEQRAFDEFENDPEKIMNDVSYQTKKIIEFAYHKIEESLAEPECEGTSHIGIVKLDDYTWKVDPEYYQKQMEQAIHLHFDFFKDEPQKLEQMRAIIAEELASNPLVAKPGEGEHGMIKPSIPNIAIKPANALIWATDKACNIPFTEPQVYEVEKAKIKTSNSKRKTGPYLSIQIKELSDNGLNISGIDRLNRFDREVHDATNSLFLAGNDYISPIMVYKVLTADREARPSEEMQAKICQSLEKLLLTWIRIDATEEAKTKGLDKLIYEGFILSATKMTASLSGHEAICYKLAKPSILYEYANTIDRIGRYPIKALASKLERNEESIILQGEIRRHVYAASGKTKMKPTILFQTLYECVGIGKDAPKTPAIRKKKQTIRKKAYKILDGFKKEKIISGYEEVKQGQEIYSVKFTF